MARASPNPTDLKRGRPYAYILKVNYKSPIFQTLTTGRQEEINPSIQTLSLRVEESPLFPITPVAQPLPLL